MNATAAPRAAAPAAGKAPDCPRCRATGAETYWFRDLYEFDVDRARALVADGREPVEVDEEDLRLSCSETRIDRRHLDHVDPTIPGIIAAAFFRNPDGEEVWGHLLIDGNHRAARCVRDGLPYLAHVLSDEESREVLLKSPEGSAHHQ